MVARKKCRRGQKGQAVIELALSLPFLIWLIYYTINGFYMIHTAHVAQKYAAMNLWQRVDNRAKFVMDKLGGLHNREFMGVRYTEPDGTLPRRRINAGQVSIFNIVGICREPGCTQ